jgi:hypothetical protein
MSVALYDVPINAYIFLEASTATNTADLIPCCLFKDDCSNWDYRARCKFLGVLSAAVVVSLFWGVVPRLWMTCALRFETVS